MVGEPDGTMAVSQGRAGRPDSSLRSSAGSAGCGVLSRVDSTQLSTLPASCLGTSNAPLQRATSRQALLDREDDLAQLLAGLEPLVRGADLLEREHRVDHGARAATRNELVGACEILARSHRGAE